MKRMYLIGLILPALWLPVAYANSQTLNEALVLEDPLKLAKQARTNGDIVRGAILFHQGTIACATCHRASSEKDRIGPDLSRLGSEATDAFIVESILQPSKKIKEGYETVRVLTTDGRVVNGLVVSDNEQQIVLRGRDNVEQLITILRSDIEQTRPSTESNMPNGLVNELKDRQQFLDLLRYVIDLRDRGPVEGTESPREIVGNTLGDNLQGLVLINNLNCVACHESEIDPRGVTPSGLKAKQPPDLKWSAQWLSPAYLAKFIANPHAIKPGTDMPHMMGRLDEGDREQAATAIIQYLVSLGGNHFQQTDNQQIDADAVARGYQVFHAVGCVACHSPRTEKAVERALVDSTPLGDLFGKYDLAALTEFLKNPLAVRSSGHMPNMSLSQREAVDVSSFLLQPSEHNGQNPQDHWVADVSLVEQGKRLFTEMNCVSCHPGIQPSVPPESIALTERLPAMGSLDPDRGCLADAPGNWPDFQFSDIVSRQIKAAIVDWPLELSEAGQINTTLVAFNCLACHSRNDLGGVSPERSPHFQTTNLNLGEQGRIPPTLTGVGAKLKPKWMRDVLVNQRAVRPYMQTRMPQYGEENVGHLVQLFQQTDQLADTEFAEPGAEQEVRDLGLEIAGNQGLNCVACHTFQYKLADTMPAVDLTEMAERLKKDWFYQYMLAPQKFSPNTVMPSFWPNGQGLRDDIAGKPKDQIEAIWQYLLDGRQARIPRGVIREPLEILVHDEAKMLRRSFQGMGKRGIGIGYPGGVNLAYDAEQMRLAMIWKGQFVDPSGAWYGQGNGTVRAMGPTLVFPPGPDLDDLSTPWNVDESRPPSHQFRGYDLDDVRRPMLKYSFGQVQVEDYFTEFTEGESGQIQLRRRIRLTSAEDREGLRFRIAVDPDISQISSGRYAVGKQLKVSVTSQQSAQIMAAELLAAEEAVEGASSILLVPVSLKAEEPQELMVEYSW